MAVTKKINKAHTPSNELARRKIVDAAIGLFERKGVNGTSMAEIAAEAGISRKTLYRVFDRPGLMEEVLKLRLAALDKKLQIKIRSYADVEEALVDGAVASVSAARGDKLIKHIVTEETDHRLEGFMLRGSGELRQGLYDMWSPIIEQGRHKDQIRTNLSNERIAELIMSTTSLLIMRDDLSKIEQKSFVKDLLVPAILRK